MVCFIIVPAKYIWPKLLLGNSPEINYKIFKMENIKKLSKDFVILDKQDMILVHGGVHSMDGNHGNEKNAEELQRERAEKEAKRKAQEMKAVQDLIDFFTIYNNFN